jgi:hypothetical protein
LDIIVPDKIPPHIRAQLEEFKRKATHNQALSKEYNDYYNRTYVKDQPTYEQWLKDNGKQRMAKGGKAKANLHKYLSDSKIHERVYHATPQDFSEFKPGGNDPRMSGKAIWTSTDPKRQPASHNIHTRGGNYKQGTNVMPLHVKAKNPLMLDDQTMIDWAQKVFAGGSREFPELLHPHHIDQVRKEGYDSIVLADPHKRGDAHEVIVFEPHQLKSAIGNRGTYDPNEPDITKAKGGNISIKEMRDYIANHGGTYEGRRFERASDEIPHLMETYDPEALKSLFAGDNAKALMTLNPADFEKFAAPIHEHFVTGHRYATTAGELPMLSHEDYIKHLANTKRFRDIPYLEINKEHQGRKELPFISGHEGRHRNRALSAKGLKTGLVQLLPRAELREPFPRRQREDYINALRNELSLMDNKVRPEKIKDEQSRYGEAKRRSIMQLPDIYAEGGDVQGQPMNTPTIAQMRHSINMHGNPDIMDNIGINEAIDMSPKIFVNPNPQDQGIPSVGGVSDSEGLPIGGVDTNVMQPGQQLNPQPPAQPQAGQPPQGGQPPQAGQPPQGPTPPQGNMLSLTPQGQTMQAMQPQGQPPQAMAEGGQTKRMFKIASAPTAKREEASFTPYEPKDISIKKLARAFDEAIAHHRGLPHEERIANSYNAAQKLGKLIGVNPNGQTKDLLGKNAKLLKTEQGKVEELKLPDGRGVETTGLALAPAYEEEGFTTCPNSASCKKECLGKTSGNYHKLGGGSDLSEFKGPRLNSLRKTQAFLHDPHSFAIRLHDEIQAAKELAGANNNHLGVRLNVLSDINPRVHKAIIEAHPDVTFYDYTKNNTNPIAPNHHYTYSSTGVSQEGVDNPNTNWKQMRKRLQGGDNVAMAFSHKGHIPETVHDEETGQKFRVINGDTHDFRPMDLQPEGEHGVIIGLKNKKATGRMNEAHIDSHGFFVHHDPKEKVVLNKKGKPIYARDAKGNTIPQNKEVKIKPQYDDLKLATNDDGEKI